jgi:hypothetical protein
MVWATSVPSEVTALRTMIQAAPTWTAWTGGGVHYPQAAITVEHGTPDSFPIALIDPGENRRTKYAAGATGLSGGSISIILYDAIESSDLETKARALLSDLLANDVGLALTDGSVGRATDPTPAQIAVKDGGTVSAYFRCITITLSYGLKG